MDDEELYLIASNEIDADRKDDALWAKVMTLADGDIEKARYEYIRQRVRKLATRVEQFSSTDSHNDFTEKNVEPIQEKETKPTIPEIDGYVSAKEFALFRGLATEAVIEMIQQATLEGRYENGHWYLRLSDLNQPILFEEPPKRFFKRLIGGGFGLSLSFWLFGVAGGIFLFFLVLVVDELISMAIVITFYSALVLRGIWNSTGIYSGPRIWSILAKVVVVAAALAVAMLVLVAISYTQLILTR